MSENEHGKTLDVLLDALKESFRATDLSIALAIAAATFLLLHGLQQSYSKAIRQQIEEQIQKRTAETTQETPAGTTTPPIEAEVPLLGFRANVMIAAMIALVLFWVGCIRATLYARRAYELASRIRALDAQLSDAMSLWPSIATASRDVKIVLCIVLTALGAVAYGLFIPQVALELRRLEPQIVDAARMGDERPDATPSTKTQAGAPPRHRLITRAGTAELAFGGIGMCVPVLFLAWQLLFPGWPPSRPAA